MEELCARTGCAYPCNSDQQWIDVFFHGSMVRVFYFLETMQNYGKKVFAVCIFR